MSSTILPKPFSAYVGLLASTLEGAADTLRNPASVVTRFPLLAMSSLMAPRERYEELAERGEHILQGMLGHFGGTSGAARRGSGTRSTVNQVQARAAARLAEAEDKFEERAGGVVTRLQDAADQATKAGQRATGGPAGPIGTSARVVAGAAGRAADRVERAADAVQPVVEQAGQAAQAVTSTTGQAVQAVTSATGEAVQAAASATGQAAQAVTSTTGQAVQAAATATGEAVQAATSATGQAAQAATGAAGQAAHTVTSTAEQAVQTATSVTGEAVQAATSVTEQAAQAATATTEQAVQAATNVTEQAAQAATATTEQAVQAATAATGQAQQAAQQAADQLAGPTVDQEAAPAPTETLWAEVTAAPTTDRGAIDEAPAAGGPNAAEAQAGASGRATTVSPADMQQGVPETRAPDPEAELRAEPGAAPTMDRGAVDAAVSAATEAAATTAEQAPAPPIPPAARKAAAKAARKAATKATPAKRVVPPPSGGSASAGSESTGAATDSTPVTTNNAGVVAAAAGETPEAAPAVPSGHRDGLDVPTEIREAAGPLREHSDLPLADFDHMTLGSLRGRLRTLDAVSLVQLLDYEQAHASRLPILSLLQNRLRKVLAD